jgi:hypothetical protein
MEATANVARAGWRQLICSLLFARESALFGLLHKIFRLAFLLLVIRVISAAAFVVILWFCPINVFANLGLYLASINLAALAVFGRYELLLVGANDDRQCADALHLCIITGMGAVAAALLFAASINAESMRHIATLFAAALFARAWLRLGLSLATRHGRYDRAVKALLPHTVGQPLTLILLLRNGYDPLMAFILSDLAGQLISAVCVTCGEWRAYCLYFRQRVRYRRIGELAAMNLRLPTLNLAAAGSAFLFTTAPLFILPGLSNAILGGTLALLFRVLDVPTALTSTSVSPILMKEVTDRKRDGAQWMTPSTFLLPATIATIVFGLICLGALMLNHLELAPSWHLALTVLPVVALFQAGIAAASPLIDIATLAGRQRGLLTLNVVSVGLAASALLLWSHTPIFAIMLAGSIGVARVIIMSVWLVGSAAQVAKPSLLGEPVGA